MPARALVVVDYQNIHLTAHEKFAPQGVMKHETLVHPLQFANQVIGERNHRITALLAAQAQAVDATTSSGKLIPLQAELAGVAVYRGQPSQARDATAYRRSMAQRSEWTRDRRVEVHYRTLRYLWDKAAQGYKAQEKGIDVLVALRVVRAAEMGDYDLVILASHDTDLEPALEDAQARGICAVETAGWQSCKVLKGKTNPRLWHTALGPAAFVRSRDRKDYT